MHILLINQVFYPDVAATAQHQHDLARHLVSRGHTVAAIASRSIYGQTGAALPKQELVDGIQVHRVGRSIFGRRNNFTRLLDFMLFYGAAKFKALFVKRPDVVIVLTTPPLVGLVGCMMKFIRRCTFIYWVMDLYPDLPIACGVMRRRGIAAWISEKLHRVVLRSADCCVVLGRCMMQRVLEKGIAPSKIRVIHVWSDADEITPLPRESNPYRAQWGLGDAFVVMYSGNYGVGHDVQTMLATARTLSHRDDIKFVFAGGGARKREVEQFINENQLRNAQAQPYQPRERLAELLCAADLHLSSQSPNMAGLFVPSKLFGVLAAARPMVFIGNRDAENALVLTENRCGEVIECGDSDALVRIIERLAANPREAQDMGLRGRSALIEKYNRQHACELWENLLNESVVPQSRRGPALRSGPA